MLTLLKFIQEGRMVRKLMLVGVLVSAFGVTFVAQSKSRSIQGAWKITQVTTTGTDARTISNPQPSLYVFTAKHYAILSVNTDQPRPDLGRGAVATATADQLRAVYNPFTANAGTYEVSADSLTARPIVAKNPGAMSSGAFTTYTFKLDGTTLTLVQKANNNGPATNPTTFTLTRVE
jgi:hypothetical protein